MSTEAINQMIEALEKAKRQCQYHNIAPHGCYDDAIAVGRQAIDTASQLKEAEKKQTNDSEVEPVAWMYPDALCDRNCLYLCTKGFTQFPECASSTPQRQWIGLTPDEIRGISLASGESLFSAIMFTHDKLKEKNTKEQP